MSYPWNLARVAPLMLLMATVQAGTPGVRPVVKPVSIDFQNFFFKILSIVCQLISSTAHRTDVQSILLRLFHADSHSVILYLSLG